MTTGVNALAELRTGTHVEPTPLSKVMASRRYDQRCEASKGEMWPFVHLPGFEL